MTRTAAILVTFGALAMVAGVAMVSVPAALILGGLLAIAGGILTIKLPDPKDGA